MTRRCALALLGLLGALVLVPLLGVGPAVRPAYAANTITIDITDSGPKPAKVTAAVGDTIQFKNADPTFVHEVGAKSSNWSFDTGPMAPGQVRPAGKLTEPGVYVYKGVNLDSFTGEVDVPSAAGPAPAPSPAKSAAPAPSRSAAASPAASAAAPSPSASPTGGSGVVGPPPLAGGTLPGPSPQPGAPGLAPAVAPTLPGEEVPSAQPSGDAVAVGHGRLPEPPTGRRYGLPAALAAVAAAGVASLLVRLLLAHPAARQAKHARTRSDLSVTVD